MGFCKYFLFLFIIFCNQVGARDLLTVATSPDNPPFEFYREGKLSGLEIDLVHLLAEKLDVDLKFRENEFSSLVMDIQANRADFAVAAFNPTAERKKEVDFSIPYFRSETVVVFRSGRSYSAKDDLHHLNIGAQLGSTHQIAAEKNIVTEGSFNKLRLYNKVTEMIQDLLNENIDVLVISEEEVGNIKKNLPELDYFLLGSGEDLAMIFRKDDPLKDKVNKALEEIIAEGGVQRLKEKWGMGPQEKKEVSLSSFEKLKDFATRIPYIAMGLGVTFQYAFISMFLGLFLGTILGILKVLPYNLPRKFAAIYTSFFRGTPLLVQLGLIYYGVRPLLGIDINAFTAGILTFTLNSTAYISEIMRSSLESIDLGQWEAAKALGMSRFQALRWVIFPQAFHRSLPSLVNEIIDLLKESALVSTIGETDLLRRGYIVASEKYTYIGPLLVVAFCYYVVVMILSKMAKMLEKKMAYTD